MDDYSTCPRRVSLPTGQVCTRYSRLLYQINLFLSGHCQTTVSTSAIPIASFSCDVHRTATITNERDLGRTTPDDRHTRHRYTRDIVTTHKKANQLWRGSVWLGVAGLSARYITATFFPVLRLLSPSLPLSSVLRPPAAPSLPLFSRWLPFGLVLDNANNTAVDKGPSDRKTLSLRI